MCDAVLWVRLQAGGDVGEALAQMLTPLKGTTHWSLAAPGAAAAAPKAPGAEAMQVDGGEGSSSLGARSSSLGPRSGSAQSLGGAGDSTARSTSSSSCAAAGPTPHPHHQHTPSASSNTENVSPFAEALVAAPKDAAAGPPALSRMSTRSKLPGAPSKLPQPEGLADRTNNLVQ